MIKENNYYQDGTRTKNLQY